MEGFLYKKIANKYQLTPYHTRRNQYCRYIESLPTIVHHASGFSQMIMNYAEEIKRSCKFCRLFQTKSEES